MRGAIDEENEPRSQSDECCYQLDIHCLNSLFLFKENCLHNLTTIALVLQ
jgi:hypothetical protein